MKPLNRIVMATVIFAQTLSFAAPSTPVPYAASEDLFRDFSPAPGIDIVEAMINRTLSDVSSQMGRNRWYIENLDTSNYYAKQYVQYLAGVNYNLSLMTKEMEKHRAEVRAFRNQERREIIGQERFKSYVEATARANPIRHSAMLSVLADQKSPYSGNDELINHDGEQYTEDWYRKFHSLVDAKEKASREYLKREQAEYQEIMQPIYEFNAAEHAKATLRLYTSLAPLLVLDSMMKFDPVDEKSFSSAEINFLRVDGKTAPKMVVEVYMQLMMNLFPSVSSMLEVLSTPMEDGPNLGKNIRWSPEQVRVYTQTQIDSFRDSAGIHNLIHVQNPVFEQKRATSPGIAHYTSAGLPRKTVLNYMAAEEKINFMNQEFLNKQSTHKLLSLLYARAAAQLGVISQSDVLNVARAKLKQIEKNPRVMLEMLSVMNQLSAPGSKIAKAINKGKIEGKYPLSINGNMCGGHF